MIASRVPGLRSVAVLLVVTAAIAAWRAWPVIEEAFTDVRPDARPVTYRYVPLTGIPLWDAVAEADGYWQRQRYAAPAGPAKTCLPFLAPILEYPNWQLRMTSGFSNCSGDQIVGDFAISSTGEVTWTRPGWPVRHLALSSEQLALVRRLDQLSCVDPEPELELAVDWLTIGLDLGKYDREAGARISPSSPLGRTVLAMLDELVAQYRQPRRELLGSFDLRLQTTDPGAVYDVRLTGGRLTVKRGRKLLIEEPVEPDLLIDLVDAVLARRPLDEPYVKGALLMNGWSVPVSLPYYEKGPFEQIHNAVMGARWTDEAQRSRGRRADTADTADTADMPDTQ